MNILKLIYICVLPFTDPKPVKLELHPDNGQNATDSFSPPQGDQVMLSIPANSFAKRKKKLDEHFAW